MIIINKNQGAGILISAFSLMFLFIFAACAKVTKEKTRETTIAQPSDIKVTQTQAPQTHGKPLPPLDVNISIMESSISLGDVVSVTLEVAPQIDVFNSIVKFEPTGSIKL